MDQLASKDKSLVSPYGDRMVQLYAEFNRPKLLPFLRSSIPYKLDMALNVVETREFRPEQVFLLGKTNPHINITVYSFVNNFRVKGHLSFMYPPKYVFAVFKKSASIFRVINFHTDFCLWSPCSVAWLFTWIKTLMNLIFGIWVAFTYIHFQNNSSKLAQDICHVSRYNGDFLQYIHSQTSVAKLCWYNVQILLNTRWKWWYMY